MNKKITLLTILVIFIIGVVGCSEEKQIKSSDIEYTLEFNDNRYMSFYISNNSNQEIKLEYPTTHTFDFRLIKDGEVVWDSFKDDTTVAKENWQTTFIVPANGEREQMIWYANIDKDLFGVYEYEFYSTSDYLKDVPHLTGKLEFLNDIYEVDRVKLIK